MKTTAADRQYAENCRKLAREAETDAQRLQLRTMADAWECFAMHAGKWIAANVQFVRAPPREYRLMAIRVCKDLAGAAT